MVDHQAGFVDAVAAHEADHVEQQVVDGCVGVFEAAGSGFVSEFDGGYYFSVEALGRPDALAVGADEFS